MIPDKCFYSTFCPWKQKVEQRVPPQREENKKGKVTGFGSQISLTQNLSKV